MKDGNEREDEGGREYRSEWKRENVEGNNKKTRRNRRNKRRTRKVENK